MTDVYYSGTIIQWGNMSIGQGNDLLKNANIHTNDFLYTDTDGEVCITGYVGPEVNLVIPDTIDGHPVTGIGDSAFYGYSQLESVTIPASITHIGDQAFSMCSSLMGIWVDAANKNYCSDADGVLFNKDKTSLIAAPKNLQTYSIADGVTEICGFAFQGCSLLTAVAIPDSVTHIGEYAFAECGKLTDVILPDGVTAIGYGAFSGCAALSTVTIPVSVNRIGDSAFTNCTGLTDVYYAGSEPQWREIAIALGNDSLTNANIHTNDFLYTITDGEVCITQYVGSKSILVIPDTFEGYPVTAIGDSAFEGCYELTEITIPDSVTSIGNSAFYQCSELISVNIPEGVTSIGNSAFYHCLSLTSVNIPEGVTSIGNAAFY